MTMIFLSKVAKVLLPVMLVAMLVVTGCSVGPEDGNSGPTGTQVGDRAPDFELQDLNGQVVSLSGLRGRPVMVNFWATWCTYCRLELPLIQEIYDGWTGKPPSVVVLTIDVGESASTVTNYMQGRGFSFPVLLDTRETIAGRYRIAGYPTTFFIDEDGIIQAKKVGAFLTRGEIESYLSKILP